VRIKKRLALVVAISMLAVAVGAVAASADVDRYQGVDYELTVSEVNGNTDYSHLFSIFRDPYLDSYSGSGWSVFHDGTESLSEFEGDDGSVSFRADYDFNDYFWFPSFILEDDGTLTFTDGYGDDNVTGAEGTWTATDTEFKNHGQYVKQAEDRKAAAHSLIGMPTQSKKKNK
jgi:opacity protein-like surface antigen